MMMTMVPGLVARAVCNNSLPATSPMNQSTSMMSKGRRRSVSRASLPRPHTVTLYPSACSTLWQLPQRALVIHHQDPDARSRGGIDGGERRHTSRREGSERADHGVWACRRHITRHPHVKVVVLLLHLVRRIYLL